MEQLLGLSQVRDELMYRIFSRISKLIAKIRRLVTFDYLERSRNIAKYLLEQEKRKALERMEDNYGLDLQQYHLHSVLDYFYSPYFFRRY